VTGETGQLGGLFASVLIYAVAVGVAPRLVFARIRRLPADWDKHPDLRDFYAGRPPWQPVQGGLLHSGFSRLLLAGAALVSFLLALNGPLLALEAGACLLAGLWLTAASLAPSQEHTATLATELELPAADVKAAVFPIVRIGGFLAWIGMLGVACFLGGSLGCAF
jgi:hypothetical protein